MALDIDFFKKVNDQYGHAVGDEVLKRFAEIAKSTIRNTDIFARIGGEEFVVLLLETDLQQAPILADRLREAVSNATVKAKERTVRFTVSIGITACKKEAEETFDTMLERADQALYRAKHNGRNRVETIF